MSLIACGCRKNKGTSSSVPIPENWDGRYALTLPDGTVEHYGTLVPARRRARETGGSISYASEPVPT